MPGPGSTDAEPRGRRLLAFLVLLGLSLTFRGYRSREGDQAYRLPILLHAEDSRVFADDPFVRAFDRFNPHRGYLTLLSALGRPLGLSLALAAVYGATFLVTCYGVDRLTRSVWPGGPGVGLVGVSLVLVAQAGNVGTNHLFGPALLDRLMAFGLGWVAFAAAVGDPRRGRVVGPIALGLAAAVHPSLGLQLAMLLGAGWVAWLVVGEGPDLRATALGLAGLGLALVPGLAWNLADSGLLLDGLAPGDVWTLTAELQSPQHMLPHLWRFPQWLAWGCYPALAGLALVGSPTTDGRPERRRLVILLGLNFAALAAAWYGVERVGHLRLTLFQPFRMATVARGLCLVLVAGQVRRLWLRNETADRLRAVLIGVGLAGDWTLVVVTGFEAVMTAGDAARDRWGFRAGPVLGFGVLAAGVVFLSRHDTESGHVPVLAATATGLAVGPWLGSAPRPWSRGRAALRLAAAWAVPLAALAANLAPEPSGGRARSVREALVRRCRFAEVPVDDVERLALWCRRNTPTDARFIGPPGPKTFRLWSRRDLAFNRAASPYHAAGLADWARRFADHVGFDGPPGAFAAAYLRDHHALEQRYDALSGAGKAALARRQGAGYVLARASRGPVLGDALTPLRVEGGYAVYRVNGPTPGPRRGPGSLARTP